MEFFRPSWGRVVSAIIFTFFPYLLAYVLFGWQINNIGWGEGVFRLTVGFVTLPLWPLWFITTVAPLFDDTFFFYVYPPLSFLGWYLISCVLAILVKKLTTQESKFKNRTPAK